MRAWSIIGGHSLRQAISSRVIKKNFFFNSRSDGFTSTLNLTLTNLFFRTSAYQVLLSFGGLLMALESKVSSGSSEMSMAVDSDLPLTNATSSPLSQLELNQNYYLALRVLR